MIERVSIENFKSYQQADLPLASLTLLIGANASGKSNAIEALHFLAWLAQGQRLEAVLEKVRAEDGAIRGATTNIVYDRTTTPGVLGLGCRYKVADKQTDFYIQLELQPGQTEMRVKKESLLRDDSTVPFYEIKSEAAAYGHEVQVAYNNFARGGIKPHIPCSDRLAIFTQLDIPSRFSGDEAREKIPAEAARLRDALAGIIFLDPNPRAMGEYSFISDKKLKTSGANVSSVLYDICDVQHRKAEVLAFIRALPEQDIADLTFLQTPRNEVMVQLTETFAGQNTRRDAPQLSDGTLRVLAIAAALLSAPTGGLVVIEEIDNGVHPSRAQMLLAAILAVAKKYDLRVLLTSHNPAMLDCLPVEAIPDVVCCYRDPIVGDSRLLRLADLTNYPELVARGPIGQLMTQGILDRYLKNQQTPEQKMAASLQWLQQRQYELAQQAQPQD